MGTGLVNGATSAKGSGHLTAQPDAASGSGWPALQDGVREAGHDLAGVGYVLVTHAHPDHLGMADRVREASGARVGMHPAEAATLRSADASGLPAGTGPRGRPGPGRGRLGAGAARVGHGLMGGADEG